MLKTAFITVFLNLVLVFCALAQSKVRLSSNFPDVEFFKLSDNSDENPVSLGLGNVDFKLEKDSKNRVKVYKEGYEPVIAEFPRTEKWDKDQIIILENRLVSFAVDQSGATISFGDSVTNQKQVNIVIPKSQTVVVKVSKPGFVTEEVSFHNSTDRAEPPLVHLVSLQDRVVKLDLKPADASFSVNGQNVSNSNSEFVVPFGKCVEVVISKKGYADIVKEYCNTAENSNTLPITQNIILEDRVLSFNALPSDASIFVNGKMESLGSYEMFLAKGKCITVNIVKDGYLTFSKNYCNQDGAEELPIMEQVNLQENEAYNASLESNFSNSRLLLPAQAANVKEESWKLLISILTKEFDVLETVDFNAGYLISAWKYQEFNKGELTTRNRVIVTSSSNSNQNEYAVKFVSQLAEGKMESRDESKFKDWNRILTKYDDLADELIERFQFSIDPSKSIDTSSIPAIKTEITPIDTIPADSTKIDTIPLEPIRRDTIPADTTKTEKNPADTTKTNSKI
ncbi:hypothetical protein Belba_0427 [Belliella baltica DSM 15883]|uniref:PEGA domain-containing protein n=1 Tax=Belliella baltica (strain DSM 15883 / CIP 108006 / LMG 21964 / BA134) TaxID=866536 RepID=I3Z1G8_BELBD|nr:hypothetical protein [Belliella baltica]AFL83086.1 hypothetical protein Belba_0427 [Belliella baltica DSM 15883]